MQLHTSAPIPRGKHRIGGMSSGAGGGLRWSTTWIGGLSSGVARIMERWTSMAPARRAAYDVPWAEGSTVSTALYFFLFCGAPKSKFRYFSLKVLIYSLCQILIIELCLRSPDCLMCFMGITILDLAHPIVFHYHLLFSMILHFMPIAYSMS